MLYGDRTWGGRGRIDNETLGLPGMTSYNAIETKLSIMETINNKTQTNSKYTSSHVCLGSVEVRNGYYSIIA